MATCYRHVIIVWTKAKQLLPTQQTVCWILLASVQSQMELCHWQTVQNNRQTIVLQMLVHRWHCIHHLRTLTSQHQWYVTDQSAAHPAKNTSPTRYYNNTARNWSSMHFWLLASWLGKVTINLCNILHIGLLLLLLPFNGLFSRTTWVSRYQKGKNQSGFYWSKRQWVAVASDRTRTRRQASRRMPQHEHTRTDRRTTRKHNAFGPIYWISGCINILGEVTSQSLWSRYDRHFVGITWYNALR